MSYICSYCYSRVPCKVAAHNDIWSKLVWQPDDSEISIPCWVLDHNECTVAMFCTCRCHKESSLEESPSHTSPSNR